MINTIDVKWGLNGNLAQGWRIMSIETFLKLVEAYPDKTFDVQKSCIHKLTEDYDGVTRCSECKRPMCVTSYRD